MKKGDIILVKWINLEMGKIKLLVRFNEVILFLVMENLFKYMEIMNKVFVKILGEIGGFGIVVICVDIIEKFFNSFFLEK